jgi:DNA-binding MurR/RpiR family transcriptional regulator
VSKDEEADPLAERVEQRAAELSPAGQRVAQYLCTHQEAIVLSTAEQLGKLTGTSNATVIRTVKALGYSGLPELKQVVGKRVFSYRTPASVVWERLGEPNSPTAVADRVLAESMDRLETTRKLLREEDLTAAVELIAGANSVFGFGVGLAELPTVYLCKRLQRLGIRASSTSATGYKLADDLLTLGAGDLVVLSAPDRLLTDMRTLITRAGKVGARILLITDSLGPIIGKQVDLTLSARSSNYGLSNERLSSIFIMDCLIAGLTLRDPELVSRRTEQLAELRTDLIPQDSRAHRKRIPRY